MLMADLAGQLALDSAMHNTGIAHDVPHVILDPRHDSSISHDDVECRSNLGGAYRPDMEVMQTGNPVDAFHLFLYFIYVNGFRHTVE